MQRINMSGPRFRESRRGQGTLGALSQRGLSGGSIQAEKCDKEISQGKSEVWQIDSCKERVALDEINMSGKIDIHEWGLRTQTRTLLLPNVVEGLWGAHDEKADMIIVIMMMKFSYDYCTGGELDSPAESAVLTGWLSSSSL